MSIPFSRPGRVLSGENAGFTIWFEKIRPEGTGIYILMAKGAEGYDDWVENFDELQKYIRHTGWISDDQENAWNIDWYGPTIYRILSASAWAKIQAAGVFTGTDHDIRDGFIHFSTADQVSETAAKHYGGQADLVLLSVSIDALVSLGNVTLRWETSRNDDLFPHLYGPLPVSAVHRVEKLPLDSAGRHVFPGDLP